MKKANAENEKGLLFTSDFPARLMNVFGRTEWYVKGLFQAVSSVRE